MALSIEDFMTSYNDLLATKQALVDELNRLGLEVTSDSSIHEYPNLLNTIDVDPTVTTSGSGVNIPKGCYTSDTSTSVATATQATPSISVSSSGKITASATQSAGYVTAGTKSSTKQLTTKAATTITPKSSQQTAVASGIYTTGAITVAGDSNLVASNIKKGVSIFGVTGTYESVEYYGTATMTGATCNSEGYFYISLSAPLVSGKHYLLSPFCDAHGADITEQPTGDSDGYGTYTNYFVLRPSSGSSVTVRVTSDLNDNSYYDMYYNGSLSFTKVIPDSN